MNLGNPIAEGNTAKIFLYQNQIIKVFHDYFRQEEAIKEATKQDVVRSSGLPVPKIIDVTKVDGCPAIVMEYVKGKTLGELMMENKEKTEYYLRISVEMQRKIHTVHVSSLEKMSEKLKRQILSTEKLKDSQKTILIDKLDEMPLESRLCHGDFHVYNLILSDNDIFIIDWVDSSIGDIRADVCRTYLLYSQYSFELAELYLHLYSEKSSISREEILEWEPIIAGARLSEIVPSENTERLMDIVNHYCAN